MNHISDFYEIINNVMEITLATAFGSSVTMRTVSPVLYNKKILFFTSSSSVKYQQLKNNPNCCIAVKGFFAEASAEFFGKTMLSGNAALRDVYSQKFPYAFAEGVPFGGREAEFIMLTLKNISGWAYNSDSPENNAIPTIPFKIDLL